MSRPYYPVQGPSCPETPEHGPLYEVGSEYVCVHSTHSRKSPPERAVYSREVVEAATRKRLGIAR